MSFYTCTRRLIKKSLLNKVFSATTQDKREFKRWVAPTLRELQRRRDKVGPEPLKPRSSYLEWNYDGEVYAFGKRLNENFEESILKTALIHKSYLEEQTDIKHNAELIEEGEEIISNYLQQTFNIKFPDIIAGTICNYLMSTPLLAHVASYMGLKDIILSKEFPIEEITLANTFKAVVAALKQSQDLEKAHIFINDFLVSHLKNKDLFDLWEPENPYELLASEIKKNKMSNVEARLCNTSGKNTILSVYRVGLYSDKKLIGIGWGESVDIAKNTAACNALQKLYKLDI